MADTPDRRPAAAPRAAAVLAVALLALALTTAAGCRSSDGEQAPATVAKAAARTSASSFRDIGKRSASDLTLR